jgi:hypothetical protein
VPNESFAKLAQMRKCIDTPRPAQAVYDECISISGWIFAEAREPSACRVRAWLEGIPIVETRLLFARADVSDFLSLPRDFPMAFRFLTRAVQPNGVSREATIEVTASWDGDAAKYSIGKVSVRLVSAGLKKQRFGKVVFPMQSLVLAPRKYLWLWPASAGTRPRDVAPYPRLSVGWKFGPRCRMRGRRLRFWAGCCEKISTASPRPMNCAIIDKPTDV